MGSAFTKQKLLSVTLYLGDSSLPGVFSHSGVFLLTDTTQTCQAVNSLRQ